MQNPSKWGVWKRNRRAALKSGRVRLHDGTVLHHRHGDKGLGTPLAKKSRAAHAAHHNSLRGRIKRARKSR